jgi:hypothetical protein
MVIGKVALIDPYVLPPMVGRLHEPEYQGLVDILLSNSIGNGPKPSPVTIFTADVDVEEDVVAPVGLEQRMPFPDGDTNLPGLAEKVYGTPMV